MVMMSIPAPPDTLSPELREAIDSIGDFCNNDVEAIAVLLAKRTQERDDCLDIIVQWIIPALEHAIEIIEDNRIVPGSAIQSTALKLLQKVITPESEEEDDNVE